MEMTNNFEKERKLRATAKATSTAIGKQRQAEKNRKCPVEGCKHVPKYFSRYCNHHAYRLRRTGHPTLNLKIRSLEDYGNCLRLGRWLRHHLSTDDADKRAWTRIEAGLIILAHKNLIDHPIPVLSRRQKSWNNEFMALCVLSRQLKRKPVEEVVAGYLGMTALILEGNELLLTAKQLELCFNKAGARAITRFGKWYAIDGQGGKTYKYNPTSGTMTRIGEIIHKAISKEYGSKWYKLAEEKIAMLERPSKAEISGEIPKV